MPFDPSLPAPNSPLESQVIRDQLQALFVLINNISSITAAQVDGVNTLPAGSAAQVNVSVSGNTLHFSFDIPQGNDGPQGQTGNDGQQGPPFAQAVVDSVNTLPAGSAASVSVSFDGSNVHFTFNIPQGNDGGTGPAGNDGAQGPPGEITQSQLDSAISGTSANTNGVSTLGLSISDPPTQGELQSVANKLDELINALRR